MENKIPAIIEKEFKAKVLELKRITEGYSHYMYLVRINKAPFEVIIRFSNNKRADFSLKKEKFIINKLRENRIPASKILAFSEDYLILEKINGERLDLIWNKLTNSEKLRLTEKMGKMLKDIHNINFEDFGRIQEDGTVKTDNPFKFRKAGISYDYDKWLRTILKDYMGDYARLISYNHINKKLMIKINEHILNKLKYLKYEEKPVLIHGDFQKGHLFIRKINRDYKIVGLIDFEFANSFAPEYDFIKLHREGFFEDKKLLKALEAGYGRKINITALKLYRIMRDVGFAQVMLDAGNKKTSDKVLRNLAKKLNF